MAMFLLTLAAELESVDIETRFAEKEVLFKKVSTLSYALISKTVVTPKEMYERLVIQDGEFGQLIIVKFDSYWGFHDTGVWAWLQGHGESL